MGGRWVRVSAEQRESTTRRLRYKALHDQLTRGTLRVCTHGTRKPFSVTYKQHRSEQNNKMPEVAPQGTNIIPRTVRFYLSPTGARAPSHTITEPLGVDILSSPENTPSPSPASAAPSGSFLPPAAAASVAAGVLDVGLLAPFPSPSLLAASWDGRPLRHWASCWALPTTTWPPSA